MRPAPEPGCLRTTLVRPLELPYLAQGLRPGAPLLCVLHGAGEKGCAPDELARRPVLAAAARYASELAVIQPCCPAGVSGWDLEALGALLDHLAPGPVVLVGTSMGGRGAWQFAYDHAARLAGLVAIAALGMPILTPRLGSLPVWMVHGAHDRVVPVARAREMAAALPAARYRELPEAGHDCERDAFEDPDLWAWIADVTSAKP